MDACQPVWSGAKGCPGPAQTGPAVISMSFNKMSWRNVRRLLWGLGLALPAGCFAAQALPAAAQLYIDREASGIAGPGRLEVANETPPSGPVILTPGRFQTVQLGAETILEAAATGQTPLQFQWQLNGSDLPGATNGTLRLPGIQPEQAGTYSVKVTDAGGFASAVIARLAVLDLRLCAGVVVAGKTGSVYRVEYAEATGDTTHWQLLGLLTLSNNPAYFMDAGSPLNKKRRYRATLVP